MYFCDPVKSAKVILGLTALFVLFIAMIVVYHHESHDPTFTISASDLQKYRESGVAPENLKRNVEQLLEAGVMEGMALNEIEGHVDGNIELATKQVAESNQRDEPQLNSPTSKN